jgi:hypothetical protein
MKRLFALIFIFAALLSCKDDITKIKKKNLIPRRDFIEILAEIHLVDVMTNSPGFSRKFEAADTFELNQQIFDKHKVTKAQFDSTVSMYIRQPDVYIKVYDEVLLKLNYMLDTLKKNSPQYYKEAIEE